MSAAVDIVFAVPMRPRPKERPRFTGRRTYTSKATKAFEQEFATRSLPWRPKRPLEGPLRVDVVAIFRRPQRAQKARWRALFKRFTSFVWRPRVPDVDNCRKAVLDAMKGVWWVDDDQVCDGRPLKVYAEEDAEDMVAVRVRSLRHEDAHQAVVDVLGRWPL